MSAHEIKTKKVEEWWDTNPFTYNGAIGVGKVVAVTDMDIAFFDKMEMRYKKHSGLSTEKGDGPVFSKFIDYESLRGKKVLDIATGTGFSTVTFARFGADVTGIDLTHYATEATKKNLALRNLPGTALQMDAQKLDFPSEYFDFVCAHGCLMHMPSTETALKEIYRVLKPGGTMYAWMYHKGWYYWFNIIFLRGILFGKLFTHGFSTLRLTSMYTDGAYMGGNPHTQLYSRKEFRKLFTHAGFKNVHVSVNNNPAEWRVWPVGKIQLGHILIPKKLQAFLSEKWGFGLGASITASKPHDI